MADSTCTMLSIQEKKPLPIPTSSIASTTMDKELDELLTSRRRLVQSKSSSFESRLHQLLSYYDSLSKIKPRYPIALERSGLETIHFSWQDSFKLSMNYTHTSINSEKISVVFNIAAIYSQMAVLENLATREGLKAGFKILNNAAATLRFLKERFGGGESVDVSRECVLMLETLMLAQAQECLFQTAVQAKKLPSTCSKAARQVELYYEEIHSALTTTPLDRHFDKAWFAHVQLKASLFYAESCYHYAVNLHKEDSIGEEIARLRMGIDCLKYARKTIKGGSSSLIDAISRLQRIMNSSLDKADKENNSIYYARVPAAGLLNNLPALVMKIPEQLESLTALEDSNNSCCSQVR